MKKQCFICKQTKDLDMFYVHREMTDGHLNKCKSCVKKYAVKRYHDPESFKRIQEYERKRFKDPARKAKIKIYHDRRRKKQPGKERARWRANAAIKNGSLVKKPCEVCGELKVHAHHHDYRKALDVKWLCLKHHWEEHNRLNNK